MWNSRYSRLGCTNILTHHPSHSIRKHCFISSSVSIAMTDSAPRRIDSILHLEDQAAWEKVPDTHELAQLHRRFWGSHDKSLELNAKAPQKSMKTPQWMTKATMKATTKMLQRSATTSVLNVPSSNLGSQLFLGRRFWSEGNIFRCTNVASTISNPATGAPRSSSLPHWSPQDNPESVGSSFCYIAVVEIYWLKGKRISIMNPWTRREISEALAHSLLPSLFEFTMSFCAALFFLNFRPPNWPN